MLKLGDLGGVNAFSALCSEMVGQWLKSCTSTTTVGVASGVASVAAEEPDEG